MVSGLQTFPLNVLAHVLNWADKRTVCRAAQTCHKLATAALSDECWGWRLERDGRITAAEGGAYHTYRALRASYTDILAIRALTPLPPPDGSAAIPTQTSPDDIEIWEIDRIDCSVVVKKLWSDAGFPDDSLELVWGKPCFQRLSILAKHKGLAAELGLTPEQIIVRAPTVAEQIGRYPQLLKIAHESRPAAKAMLQDPNPFFLTYFSDPYGVKGEALAEALSAYAHSTACRQAHSARHLLRELMPGMFDKVAPHQALFLLARPYAIAKNAFEIRKGLARCPHAATLAEVEREGDLHLMGEIGWGGHPALRKLDKQWKKMDVLGSLAINYPMTLRSLASTLDDRLYAHRMEVRLQDPPDVLLGKLVRDDEHQIRIDWLRGWMPQHTLPKILEDRPKLTEEIFARPAMLFMFKMLPGSGKTFKRENLTVEQLERELTQSRNWKIFSPHLPSGKGWKKEDLADPYLCLDLLEQSADLAYLDPKHILAQGTKRSSSYTSSKIGKKAHTYA